MPPLHENGRRQLADFSATSAAFVHERAALEAFVLSNYEEFYRARHASATYDFTPATFSTLAARDEVLLVGAGSHGRLQAVSMFGYMEFAGDYLFNVSVPEGRGHSAALIWFAATTLRSLGIPTLNLGGGMRGYDGVAHFQERFGQEDHAAAMREQIYRPDVHRRLCRTAGVDPERERRYFPAYRAACIGQGTRGSWMKSRIDDLAILGGPPAFAEPLHTGRPNTATGSGLTRGSSAFSTRRASRTAGRSFRNSKS